MKILRVTALVLALMLLAAACGGGDDDDAGTGAGAGASADPHADHMEFCETVVAAETAVLTAASGGDPGPVEGLVAKVEETAPDELEDQLTLVVAAVREALKTKDDKPFNTDEFSRNEEEVDQWVAQNCGFEAVPVTAVDYAFKGVPKTLPAGFTAFHFTNGGEEVHEMIMVRYKDESLTLKDVMKLSDKEAEKKLVFLGASFGPPGASDTEVKELEPGKYALVCFVPVGSTSEKAAKKANGPPHVARGMSAEFTVE